MKIGAPPARLVNPAGNGAWITGSAATTTATAASNRIKTGPVIAFLYSSRRLSWYHAVCCSLIYIEASNVHDVRDCAPYKRTAVMAISCCFVVL